PVSKDQIEKLGDNGGGPYCASSSPATASSECKKLETLFAYQEQLKASYESLQQKLQVATANHTPDAGALKAQSDGVLHLLSVTQGQIVRALAAYFYAAPGASPDACLSAICAHPDVAILAKGKGIKPCPDTTSP